MVVIVLVVVALVKTVVLTVVGTREVSDGINLSGISEKAVELNNSIVGVSVCFVISVVVGSILDVEKDFSSLFSNSVVSSKFSAIGVTEFSSRDLSSDILSPIQAHLFMSYTFNSHAVGILNF